MLLLETEADQPEEREPGHPPPPTDVAAMSWLRRRYRDISPVTLQVVGGAMSSSLYCGEVEGLVGGAAPLVDSFLVELYRCKVCHYTCGLRTAITSHVQLRHRPHSLTYLGGAEEGGREEASEEAGLQQVASPYRLELSGESKQNDEDEDFLLYNMMLDNMSPPTCDISSEGGLQVAHTCEVSTLFEEGGGEGVSVDLSMCPPSSQEEMAQSAHLMTLGLCRISAPRVPPPPLTAVAATSPHPSQPPPPPADPPHPPSSSADSQRQSSQMRSGRRLVCALCPAALVSRRLLDVHLRSHQVGGGFSCVRCGWTTTGWDELETHWTRRCRRKKRRRRRKKAELHGTGGKAALGQAAIGRAVQEEAGLTYSQNRTDEGGDGKTKTVGRQKEAERTGFCCSLCHKKFSSKLTLRRHQGVHGGDKPFACQHCSYRSRLKASLLQHLRTHTGERPHQCPQCSYASIDRSSLLRHCRTHSQEKPYQCELCDYSSIQKKSLDLHARRHHTGEAFPCQQCQYSSPDRQLLLRHVRRHHHATATPTS